MLRLAEMYLNYAEADARLNNGTVTDGLAKSYVKELRDRAGVATPASITTDWILEERAREFMWEGHRRVDLIRYGKFTSSEFPWVYKGGVENGNSQLSDHLKIYPLVASDLSVNKKLEQNPGYEKSK